MYAGVWVCVFVITYGFLISFEYSYGFVGWSVPDLKFLTYFDVFGGYQAVMFEYAVRLGSCGFIS